MAGIADVAGNAPGKPGTANAARMVGSIGGMSWESTVTYYQELNRRCNALCGGHSSAPVLIHSVDSAAIEAIQCSGDWVGAASSRSDAAVGLERAGATVLLLATNTMRLVVDHLHAATSVPWIHIADTMGEALRRYGRATVGLLGTRFTMEEKFYTTRLTKRYGLDGLVPDARAWSEMDGVIFEELVHGLVTTAARKYYVAVIEKLARRGAEAVILGCTDIGLLFGSGDGSAPVSISRYDTTILHVEAALAYLTE